VVFRPLAPSRSSDFAVVRIPPAGGRAFVLRRGQTLRVIDPLGGQVADLLMFGLDADDRATTQVFSAGRSIDYANRLYLTTGDTLYSNRSTPMLLIGRDDCKRHDCTLTPCSPEMYRILYGDDGTHPSCFANLRDNLTDFGVDSDQIPTTFNVFMNVTFAPADAASPGEMNIGPPLSRPGDVIEFEAKMDLAVGLTACASEATNHVRHAGELKPIDYSIIDPAPPAPARPRRPG
jgi:uncharacterized protein YcgI (DUF1989 family)